MLEAMGMGLPVVCTNCPIGGAGEVIKNKENGILVPTNDVKALTEAMLELLDNPDLRNKIRKNAEKKGKKIAEPQGCCSDCAGCAGCSGKVFPTGDEE